ncbi:diguanylate cyclase [Thalassotalea insulae]|uniref:diguanylate cyclase n=1 Tax=Thalassotalea insulae TaxID=2056778 RepID=UPI0024E04856|nr:diguanylate cyclase [Thalassotalea insulae]
MTKVIIIFITLLLSVSHKAGAEQVSLQKQQVMTLHQVSTEKQLFSEPWSFYQKLLASQKQFPELANEEKLWLLVRRAQCENLLYFYDKFADTTQELKALVNDNTNIIVQAYLAYYQGVIKQRDGDYQGSRVYFKQTMALTKQVDRHLYVTAKLELAYTHSLSELFDTSLADMQEAYIEAFALNDNFLIATINETYGAIYGYMRQNEKSLEYYQKALDSYEKLGYKAHIAEAIYGIATTYRYWKKYDLAVENFKLYQKKITYTPNTNIIYFASYGLGMTLAEQGNCHAALVEIERAFIHDGLDDFDAELYKRKASCLIQLQRLDEAEQALNNARALFQKIPELLGTAWHLEVDKIAGKLAYAKQDYQVAYQLLATYYQKYTDILIENSSARVASIRASMEIERQEVEQALSKQRIRAEKLAFKTQEQETLQHRYFIIFLLILLLIVFAIVVYQHRTNRKIFELSIVDSLSGLYNRRYIFEHLDKQISRTSADKGTLSIILFDIDDFKRINDCYGHPSGDLVIEQIAKITIETLRTEDVSGRIGGEEFLAILPRTDLEQGEIIAERLRENINNHQFMTEDGHRMSISASFGVAQLTLELNDSKSFYAVVDEALYLAKAQGKNCVMSARNNIN